MQIKKLFLGSILSLNILTAQSNVGLDINNEDIEVLTSIDLNNFLDYSSSTLYTLDGRYLHTDTNNMTSIGISAQNTLPALDRISFTFGLKSIFALNYLAFPFYAKASLELPFEEVIPSTTISTSIAYSPSVITFIDGENYREFRLEADMEVIPNIHLFTGYRNIDTNYEDYDKEFNDKFYGGMKLSF